MLQDITGQTVVKGKIGPQSLSNDHGWGEVDPWEKRKRIAAGLLSRGYEREADRFCHCGRRLLKFVGVGQEPDVLEKSRGARKVSATPFEYGIRETCKSRLCERCAEAQYRKFRDSALEIVKSLPRGGKRRVSFLTVTFKTQPLTKTYIRQCIKALRSFVNIFYGNWLHVYKKRSSRMVKTKNRIGCGALGVLEIGPGGNLHFHLLVYGYYHPIKFMSKIWTGLTGDSYRLWINNVSVQTRQSPERAVRYILKYIRKPQGFSSASGYVDFFEAMSGIRRIHTYGVFYGREEWALRSVEPLVCPFTGDRLVCIGTAAKGEILIDYHAVSKAIEENRARAPDTILFLWSEVQRSCADVVASPLVKSLHFPLDRLADVSLN